MSKRLFTQRTYDDLKKAIFERFPVTSRKIAFDSIKKIENSNDFILEADRTIALSEVLFQTYMKYGHVPSKYERMAEVAWYDIKHR